MVLSVTLIVGTAAIFTGCSDDSKDVLTIAVFEGGRGSTFMDTMKAEYEKAYPGGKKIEILKSSQIGDDITKRINEKNAPDLIFLSVGNPSGVTERLISGDKLEDLSSMLDETVDGAPLKDNMVDNILSNFACQPKGDGKTYLMPLFYSPTGMWYNKDAFGVGEGKYTLPNTWDEFWALGDSLPAGKSLFTIPTPGYLDCVMYSEIANYTGSDGYIDAMKFADGFWEKPETKAMLGQIAKMGDYFDDTTITNATTQGGFTANQQKVIDGTAMFVPNGDWLPGEMIPKDVTDPNYEKNKNFNWGFTGYPAKDATGKAYVNAYLETVMIHKDADCKAEAKEFMKFMFSEKGAEIIAKDAKTKAIIPTKKAVEKAAEWGVPASTIDLYEVFKTYGTVTGGYVAYKAVPDLIFNDILFNNTPVDVWKKNITVNDWAKQLEDASDKIRPNIGK